VVLRAYPKWWYRPPVGIIVHPCFRPPLYWLSYRCHYTVVVVVVIATIIGVGYECMRNPLEMFTLRWCRYVAWIVKIDVCTGRRENNMKTASSTYVRIQSGHCVRACNVQYKGRAVHSASPGKSRLAPTPLESKIGICTISAPHAVWILALYPTEADWLPFVIHAGLNTFSDSYYANANIFKNIWILFNKTGNLCQWFFCTHSVFESYWTLCMGSSPGLCIAFFNSWGFCPNLKMDIFNCF
jgi:hypothetical protein